MAAMASRSLADVILGGAPPLRSGQGKPTLTYYSEISSRSDSANAAKILCRTG